MAGLGGMVKAWESRRRLDFPTSAVLSHRKDPEKVNGPGSLRNSMHISKMKVDPKSDLEHFRGITYSLLAWGCLRIPRKSLRKCLGRRACGLPCRNHNTEPLKQERIKRWLIDGEKLPSLSLIPNAFFSFYDLRLHMFLWINHLGST